MPVVSLCTEAGKGSGMNAEKKQKIPYFLGKLSKIAGIFGVPITKALDPRHLFYTMDKVGKYGRRAKAETRQKKNCRFMRERSANGQAAGRSF